MLSSLSSSLNFDSLIQLYFSIRFLKMNQFPNDGRNYLKKMSENYIKNAFSKQTTPRQASIQQSKQRIVEKLRGNDKASPLRGFEKEDFMKTWQISTHRLVVESIQPSALASVNSKNISRLLSIQDELKSQTPNYEIEQVVLKVESKLNQLIQHDEKEKAKESLISHRATQSPQSLQAFTCQKFQPKARLQSPDLDGSLKFCLICLDKEREFVVIPCGHFIYCGNCKDSIKGRCHLCQTPVCQILRVYL